MARAPIARYGIAEWFGKDITSMTPKERQTFGQLAALQDQTGDLSNAPICPFLSTLIPAARCNKASGVCSIRRFLPGPNSSGSPVPGDKIVTVCPSRFLQTLDDGKSVFVWISEKMLDVANPTVIKETPFFAKFRISYAPRKRRHTSRLKAQKERKRPVGSTGFWLHQPQWIPANLNGAQSKPKPCISLETRCDLSLSPMRRPLRRCCFRQVAGVQTIAAAGQSVFLPSSM